MAVRPSNGEVYAAFLVRSPDVAYVFRSTDRGMSWTVFSSINWDSLGAVVNDMDLCVAEGDSVCVFLAFSLSYGGASIERLMIYRYNLDVGSDGIPYVLDYPSPRSVRSPRIASDFTRYSNYRVRVAWIVSATAGDSIFYSSSVNTGAAWTTPTLSYAPGGALGNMSFAQGNNLWWVVWDRNDRIYAKDLLASGNPRVLSPSNFAHYRPTLAVADTLNSRGGTTMVTAFIRRWSTDLGTIYVYSTNSGQTWSPVDNPLGIDDPDRDEFNPHASYSVKSRRFYIANVSRDVNQTNRAYRIRAFSASHDTPSSLRVVSPCVNDDSTGGSASADPFIVDNPLSPDQPMVLWRHWPGSGEGRILFDAADRVAAVVGGSEIPGSFWRLQNYPNPFNPSTSIGFGVSGSGIVSLKVYNFLGQEVATLVNEELEAGSYEVTWDANQFPSGVYFVRMSTGDFRATRKIVLLR
jgi:hypothetical protein